MPSARAEPTSHERPTLRRPRASHRARPQRSSRGEDAALHADLHVERGGDRSVRLHSRVRAGRGHRRLARHLATSSRSRDELAKQSGNRADLTCGVVTSSLFGGMSTRASSTRSSTSRRRCGPHYRQLAVAARRRSRPTSWPGASGCATRRSGGGHHLHRLRRGARASSAPSRWTSLPRIIPADEWAHVEPGLVAAGDRPQQVPRRPLRRRAGGDERRHRPELARHVAATASSREAFGIPVPRGARCLVAGIDLVRDADGTYRVLEDNLRNPSGISYVLENRAAMTRVLPRVFGDHRVRPRRPLRRVAARTRCATWRRAAAGRPDASSCSRPACSTPPTSSTRSSPARWASSSSRAATSSSTTTSCPCAPRAGSSASTSSTAASTTPSSTPWRSEPTRSLGVPGLMAAARAGNVTDRERRRQRRRRRQGGVRLRARPHPLLPRTRSRSSPNVDTYLLLGRGPARRTCSSRLDELVVKPVAGSGGYGMLIGPHGDRRGDRGASPQLIEANPRGLHRAGGRAPVAAPDAGRRPPRGPPHRPAAVRAVGRADRGHPGRAHAGRAAQGARSS